MARIISFANQKGGVGKSTVTLLAAGALSQPPFSYKVLVVDVDPQQSITAARRYDTANDTAPPPYDVQTCSFDEFAGKVSEVDAQYQIVFVDVPGKLDAAAGSNSEAVRALQFLDLVLVPVTPGNFGLEATVDYLKAVRRVQQQRGKDLRLAVFRNMHQQNTRNSAQLTQDLREVSDMIDAPLVWMETPLKRYADFMSTDTLQSMYAPKGSSSPARRNLTEWVDELHQLTIS